MNVPEIVFTGGPCGGKTTAMAEVADRLRNEGWRVLVVPEAATMFIEGGVGDIATLALDPARMAKFRRTLISTQGALRQRYRAMAQALGDERCVILYDRAECDSAAYVPDEWFTAALHSEGLRLMEVRDSYDAVIHLTSAAVGNTGQYTTENNPARHETLVEAALLDAGTLNSWLGHPRLTVVGNYENFDDKIERAYTAVRAALGVPTPLEIEHKYLVTDMPKNAVLGDLPRVLITQTYLEPGRVGTEERVRCTRTQMMGRPCGPTPPKNASALIHVLKSKHTWMRSTGLLSPHASKRVPSQW